MDRMLTTEQAAALLGRSVALIKRYCAEGRFPGAWKPTPRSTWLIPEESVTAFVLPPMGRPKAPKREL